MSAARGRLLTVDEVAERLRVSKRTAYRLVKEIKPQPGGRLLIADSDVERYIASHMHGTPEGRHPLAQLLADEAASARAALPGCCSADGFIYFVGHSELVKIGRSKTHALKARMAHLQCMSPVPLRLLHLSRGYELERLLHERFHQHRAHGEWFWRDAIEDLLRPGWPCVRCLMESAR